MADTRALLDRITAFRSRLEQAPESKLAPSASHGHSMSVPSKTNPVQPHESVPVVLSAKAQRLLNGARELVRRQKDFSTHPVLRAMAERSEVAVSEPIVQYHRATVCLTESALKLVTIFPSQTEAQLRACEGLEQLLLVVEQRLQHLQQAIQNQERESMRVDRLASLLETLHAGKPIEIQSVVDLAETILDDARSGQRLRYCTHAITEDDTLAKQVARQSILVAQVVARLVPFDFEWASKPVLPMVVALLMDVGVLDCEDGTLQQLATLEPSAKAQYEQHPRRGAALLRTLLPDAEPLAEVVAAHHESLDGTGFPNGLRDSSIPSCSRLLAVADAYAKELTTPHDSQAIGDTRNALTNTLILAENGQLDRDFTEYLLNLTFYPVGTVVELSDARVAVVVSAQYRRLDLQASSRPVVAVLIDADGQTIARPKYVDLSSTKVGSIRRVLPTAERWQRLGESYPDLCD